MYDSVQWGQSACRRAFIALRTNKGAVCLFQRYSDLKGTWAVGDGENTGLLACSGYPVSGGSLVDPLIAFNIFNLLVGHPQQFGDAWAHAGASMKEPFFLV